MQDERVLTQEIHQLYGEVKRTGNAAIYPSYNNTKSSAEWKGCFLTLVFRGELVPQDPNNEPASVLLERIRARQSKPAPKGTARRRHNRKGQMRLGV